MLITRQDYWGDLDDMQRQMERFLDHFASCKRRPVMFSPGVWQPLVDVYETADNVVVRVELAGVKQEDVKIILHNNTLILKGERRDSRAGRGPRNFQLMEVNFGRFERTIALPAAVDTESPTASLENGFLVIEMKKAPEPTVKSIEVLMREDAPGR